MMHIHMRVLSHEKPKTSRCARNLLLIKSKRYIYIWKKRPYAQQASNKQVSTRSPNDNIASNILHITILLHFLINFPLTVFKPIVFVAAHIQGYIFHYICCCCCCCCQHLNTLDYSNKSIRHFLAGRIYDNKNKGNA